MAKAAPYLLRAKRSQGGKRKFFNQKLQQAQNAARKIERKAKNVGKDSPPRCARGGNDLDKKKPGSLPTIEEP